MDMIKEEGPDPCPPPQLSEESPCLAPELRSRAPELRSRPSETQVQAILQTFTCL